MLQKNKYINSGVAYCQTHLENGEVEKGAIVNYCLAKSNVLTQNLRQLKSAITLLEKWKHLQKK